MYSENQNLVQELEKEKQGREEGKEDINSSSGTDNDDGDNSDSDSDSDNNNEEGEEEEESDDEQIIELSPKAQRLAMALLCYYDFTTGRKHTYIDDVSIFFDINDFLVKQTNVGEFLLYVLNYTNFFLPEVCNYFIKMGCDPELVNAKNLDYVNDVNNELSPQQITMAKFSLDNLMRFEPKSLPRGNNSVLFKKLGLCNRELLIISSRMTTSRLGQTFYLDIIDNNLTVDDANHYLLNDYQLDYIIKHWPVEKYIDYLAMFADNNNLHTILINNIPFDKWSACPPQVKLALKSFSHRVALMVYKDILTKKS